MSTHLDGPLTWARKLPGREVPKLMPLIRESARPRLFLRKGREAHRSRLFNVRCTLTVPVMPLSDRSWHVASTLQYVMVSASAANASRRVSIPEDAGF